MRYWPAGTTLGEALISEMERRGLTFQQTATEIGTNTTNIDRWRNDGTVPRGALAQALMDWLETDIRGFGALVVCTLLSRDVNCAQR